MVNLAKITFDNLQLSNPISEVPAGQNQSIQQPRRHLPAALQEYVTLALADNSRKAYQGDLDDFRKWGGSIPCTPEVLAEYIVDRADSLSPVTITRRVTGISRAHTSLGFADPAKNDLVRVVLKGVRRARGRPQRQATPVLRRDLLAMIEHAEGAKGVRDRALLLIGFAAALRRSELVALDVSDIAFVQEGLVLHLRRSKTDQEGEGRKIGVPWGRTSVCPVKALQAWISHAQITAGPIFTCVKKGGGIGHQRLSTHAVAEIVKSYAKAIGLDPANVSGHSLRAGLVTSAAKAGVAGHKIQQQTGHRSSAMLARYIRDADLFADNAAGIL